MKSFNLHQKHPKVLLFGNGLTYSETTKWEKIISAFAKDNAPEISTPGIPYSVLATIKTDITDESRHNKYDNFFTKCYHYQNYPELAELMRIPFDAVLTTNYTYEAEEFFVPNFHLLGAKKLKNYWAQTKEKKGKVIDPKYLLHTYNRVTNGVNEQEIWHIHGETRRKSSLVLTHDEYSRLICELVEYNRERGRDFYNYSQDVHFESWVDYLLLGDLHIIGFGFDFSEFDLWWLLTRRLKEETGTGKLIFYAPEKEKDRPVHDALRAMGATVEHCGENIDKGGSYPKFYKKAISLIENA